MLTRHVGSDDSSDWIRRIQVIKRCGLFGINPKSSGYDAPAYRDSRSETKDICAVLCIPYISTSG